MLRKVLKQVDRLATEVGILASAITSLEDDVNELNPGGRVAAALRSQRHAATMYPKRRRKAVRRG